MTQEVNHMTRSWRALMRFAGILRPNDGKDGDETMRSFLFSPSFILIELEKEEYIVRYPEEMDVSMSDSKSSIV